MYPDEVPGPIFRVLDATKPVAHYPIAAYGLPQPCATGYYTVTGGQAKRTYLWTLPGDPPNIQTDKPALPEGSKRTFQPKDDIFGLWIATFGFSGSKDKEARTKFGPEAAAPDYKGEVVYTEDARQTAIKRFAKQRHKAHVFPARDQEGNAIKGSYIIGWEYSTNDDDQDLVTRIDNVQLVVSRK